MAKRKKKKAIVLKKTYISFFLVLMGVLYFFAKISAPNSILHEGPDFVMSLFFGQQGNYVLFGGMIGVGLLAIVNEKVLNKGSIRKLFIIMCLIGAILNLPILDNKGLDAIKYGGWVGYAILWGAFNLLGQQIMSIKVFISALLFGFMLWEYHGLGYRFSFSSFEVEIEDAPLPKETKKEKMEKTTKEKILKPSKPSRSITSMLFGDASEKENEDSYEGSESIPQSQETGSKDTIKKLLRSKIEEKISEKQMKQVALNFPEDKPTFDINLLDKPAPGEDYQIPEKYLIEKAETLKQKLLEFEIPVSIEGFNIGPTVIQVKVKPDAGIKVSKIENLKKDLALSLKTKTLRIISPIPGTEFVGVEFPNPKPAMVRIGEILGSVELSQGMNDNLTNLSIGKSIDGKKFIKSLESMPHVLVAGATGQGKSVGINDFIISLIYQNTPSELRFIMVDPKQVELSIYEGIPYLLSPIITEPEKAVKVLKWVVGHMNERYLKLKESKVRNIDEFNDKVDKKDKMYRIVVIIDELADLMMSGNKKDTENAIARIAQMARAVGIHLIVATQRPSVNVITGLIKANIPTRIAYGVVSIVDSRTIIDEKGAEDLVGRGDMLYIDPSNKFPIRIQAPYISTAETERVVNEIKDKYMQGISENEIYHPEIVNILTSKAEIAGGGEISEDDEELVQQATDIIINTRKASATLLQRKLGIGFARAARIMDILEDKGIVGPQEGAKPREILI